MTYLITIATLKNIRKDKNKKGGIVNDYEKHSQYERTY